MEFSIKQSILKEELGYIQGVVERKSTIPVLSNILIESLGEGSIRIVGTDLDVTIRCDAEADIKKPGAMCVQARKLFDIVRTLSDGDVHFKKEENEWVEMKAGRAKFRLAGVNKEQYPEIPIFKSAPMKLSADVFNYFIQNTAFAITNETSRFTLSGAKFVIDGEKARMVTTDGHRLSKCDHRAREGMMLHFSMLVPGQVFAVCGTSRWNSRACTGNLKRRCTMSMTSITAASWRPSRRSKPRSKLPIASNMNTLRFMPKPTLAGSLFQSRPTQMPPSGAMVTCWAMSS